MAFWGDDRGWDVLPESNYRNITTLAKFQIEISELPRPQGGVFCGGLHKHTDDAINIETVTSFPNVITTIRRPLSHYSKWPMHKQ